LRHPLPSILYPVQITLSVVCDETHMMAGFEEGLYSEQWTSVWPEIPPPPMKIYAMIVISLKLFMNFSDRLRRLGTLVKVHFPLETVPKKSVKTFHTKQL